MQTKFELYQKVTPLAHLGIWERNLLTGEIYWNEVVYQILDVDADYIPTLDQTINYYTDPDAVKQLIDDTLKSGRAETRNLQLRTVKNNLKWVKVRMQADIEGSKYKVIYGTIEDITSQVQLTARLAEQEEQFYHAFEFAPIGMALVSTGGEWIRVNKELCQLLNYTKEELIRKTFQEITHPDDLNSDLTQMQQVLDNEISSYQMDKRYLRKDGQIVWVTLHVTLVRDTQAAPLYFVSQIKDITEHRLMEQEQVKAMEIISAQNSRLLNFAHIVSHNLRSHSANIQMLFEMITAEADVHEKDNLIAMLGSNAVQLQQTLDHLNVLVDVHAGTSTRLKRIKLAAEVAKIAGTLNASFIQVGGKLSIAVAPEIYVDYDQAYLDSILLNLITNAIKYRSAQRTLEVNISAVKQDSRVILQVNDNGLGIDLATHGDKLFGMYRTFHGNNDARGIGLFLVRNQVEAMGGNISVKSKPDEGTTFTVEFKKQATD